MGEINKRGENEPTPEFLSPQEAKERIAKEGPEILRVEEGKSDHESEKEKIEARYEARTDKFREVLKELFDRPNEFAIHDGTGRGNFEDALLSARRLQHEKDQKIEKSYREPTRDESLATRLQEKLDEIDRERDDALAALGKNEPEEKEKNIDEI